MAIGVLANSLVCRKIIDDVYQYRSLFGCFASGRGHTGILLLIATVPPVVVAILAETVERLS